jgi:transposase-like protein
MVSSCGVSKSSVSREAAEAGEEALKELLERRFDKIDLLVIYIDGMQFGEHHVTSAVGVDRAGHKHVLGIQQGATENAAAVEDLLEQLVARGVDPKAKRLFVINGAKALRGCDPQSVWNAASGAALPQSQDPQRVRPTAGGTEGPGKSGHAHQLQTGG